MCTHLVLKAKNGDIVVGRTLEFGPPLDSKIVTSPRQTTFHSTSASGKGIKWISNYAYLYFTASTVIHPVDGLNEKGLSFAYLYLPEYTQYPEHPKSGMEDAIDYWYLGDWILGQFKSVGEVRQAIQHIEVFADPVDAKPFVNTVFPFHVMVTDASGQSITIQWIEGKMHIYDNPTGILTNQPPYPWHLANMQNYVNLSPYKPESYLFDGVNLYSQGCGYGAVGLPGDSSSPARFIKTSFLKAHAYPALDGEEAINLAEHILNNVDLPSGVARERKEERDAPPDITQWTTFKDLTTRRLYFKSYENTSIKVIEMDKLDLSKGASILSIAVKSVPQYEDVSGQFHPGI